MLGLLTVGHLIHVWGFWLSEAERMELPARLVAWREGIGAVHAGSALAALCLTAAARWAPDRWISSIALVAGTTYLLHAAAVAGVDQLNTPTVTPYMAYAIVMAMLLVVRPLPAAAMFGVGLVALQAALLTMQPDPEIRRTFLPNGPSVTVAAIAMVAFLYGARRRDFVQRLIIQRQQNQLETWNLELEGRVDAQVNEIRRNAEEVERLNAQLQVQVRDRSRELARALERLAARQEHTSDLDGRVLGGRFELFHRIGSGGMGAVYEGVDQTTRQRVAVKVVRSGAAPIALLRRFLREAESVASVSHPAIVRMLHVDVDDDGTFFQAQELVDGETLAQILRRHGRFAPPVVARVLAVLTDALAAAHARGLVHRDVKPANIMLLAADPGLKLLDFGIAKLRDVVDGGSDDELLTSPDAAPVTRAGAMIGTPGFMAPEQLVGDGASERSDVFAVGLVGLLMLTGSLPDHRATATDGTSPLEVALAACLASRPTDRPGAHALSARFAAIADTLGAPALEVLVARDALRATSEATADEATLPGVED